MKNTIIVGIIIFLSVIAFAVISAILIVPKDLSKDNIEVVNNIYSKYSKDVDGAINNFMSSKEYIKMTKDGQVKAIGELLKLYQDSSIIKNLYYDEPTTMYTFTYNSGDIKGALGGVSLKTWNPMMN